MDDTTATSNDCAQCAEYLDGWKRSQADYANLKRDTEQFRAEFAKFAAARTLESLLPVFDSFEKAAAAPPAPGADPAQWIVGISHIRTQLVGALRELGVEAVGTPGEPFDPARHEAVGAEAGGMPGSVARLLEPGWSLHGKVLKPARVIVSQ